MVYILLGISEGLTQGFSLLSYVLTLGRGPGLHYLVHAYMGGVPLDTGLKIRHPFSWEECEAA